MKIHKFGLIGITVVILGVSFELIDIPNSSMPPPIKLDHNIQDNVHYINSDDETIVVSGPHSSVSTPPEVILFDKDTKMIKSRFNTSYDVSGIDMLGDHVFLIEGDLVKILDPQGKILAQYGMPNQKKETRGTQIEINNYQIYVLDTWNNQIQIFNFRIT